MELLSALDNVLSQKAEDTLTEFAAVKKALCATANKTHSRATGTGMTGK